MEAAEEELEEIKPEQRQSYISAETWKLIEDRQKARGARKPAEEMRLTKLIKIKTNQDKQKSNIAALEKREH